MEQKGVMAEGLLKDPYREVGRQLPLPWVRRPRWFVSNTLASIHKQAVLTLATPNNVNLYSIRLTGKALISPVGGGDTALGPDPFETPLSL